MQYRKYQAESHAAISSEFDKGVYRQLISMATGTGKTIMFAQLWEHMRSRLPGQMLVLAHREELIDQAISKMQKVNPTLRIDKEKAEHKADPSLADIVVASVSSLGRKGTKRIDKYNWANFDKIVTDEAHHSIAQSYMNIYESAGVLKSDRPHLFLGMTATPQRGDGKALAALYQKITYVYSIRQAIEDGWLVDVKGIKVKTNTSLDSVKTVAGDFDDKALANTVNTPKRNLLVTKAYLEHGGDRPAIGFTVDIQHAKDLAAMFQEHGVQAEAIWGTDPDRAKKLAMHRNGSIKVLLNCGVLTEGYDDWRIGCIILACPTKSAVKFTQMVGRGTRLEALEDGFTPNLLDWTGKPIKQDCIILDIVDSTSYHSLVTLPTLMGMATSLDLKGKSLVGAVKALEEAQHKYQHLDFGLLDSIDNIESYIEKVNLFEVKFSQEVENNSEFSWHSSATGGYILMLPNKDEIRISQNMLDKYELFGKIKGKRYKGERDRIEDAFSAADKLVLDTCPESLKIIKRKESWHSLPPTSGQLKLIGKFFKGKPLPNNLTRGQASKLIGSKLAGKAK